MARAAPATLGPVFDSRDAVRVVALPGTGSDAHFARQAFGPACTARDIELIAIEPDPRRVVASYRAGLAAAAHSGPIIAAGVSLGAAIAVEWAAEHTEQVAGIIAALPAWTGSDAGSCPAALSAAATAAQLRTDGLAATVEHMRASTPEWLSDALTRSWNAQWPHLPEALEEAARYPWPDTDLLTGLNLPIAVVAAIDDPVHPVAVGEQWAALAAWAHLSPITLDDIGADPAILGHKGFDALHRVHRDAGFSSDRAAALPNPPRRAAAPARSAVATPAVARIAPQPPARPMSAAGHRPGADEQRPTARTAVVAAPRATAHVPARDPRHAGPPSR